MFDELQKKSVIQAYDFACKIGNKHARKIEKNVSSDDILKLKTLRSIHSPEELKKRLLDLAVEYTNWKMPSSNNGLISNLEGIEAELKGLIMKLDSLKRTAPDTFDDIAYGMYSPYLRNDELKAQTFTYYDPQIELKHLVRAVGLTKRNTQTKTETLKKRGAYWSRIERIWLQITNQPPKTSQNSDFIIFSGMIFNSAKCFEDAFESPQALSKDYRRYLEAKRSRSLYSERLDKND